MNSRLFYRGASALRWQRVEDGPVGRLDAAAAQVGHRLFVLGGYSAIDHVLSLVDVLDLATGCWTERMLMPRTMAQSHLGVATDGRRYVYCVGGQLGPHCSPAVSSCFVLDCESGAWSELPELPEPRYAPCLQLRRGVLHVMGGSKSDRATPSVDHWTLPVRDGEALESKWATEDEVPRGGPHRTSFLIDDRIYLLGGQEGDVVPVAGCLEYRCDPNSRRERVYAECWREGGPGEGWLSLPDMPVAASHTEFAAVAEGDSILVLGGSIQDPRTGEILLTDLVQELDCRQESWRIRGRLPGGVKTALAGIHDGWLYVTAGEWAKDRRHPGPPGVLHRRTWRARLN